MCRPQLSADHVVYSSAAGFQGSFPGTFQLAYRTAERNESRYDDNDYRDDQAGSDNQLQIL